MRNALTTIGIFVAVLALACVGLSRALYGELRAAVAPHPAPEPANDPRDWPTARIAVHNALISYSIRAELLYDGKITPHPTYVRWLKKLRARFDGGERSDALYRDMRGCRQDWPHDREGP